MATGTTRRRTRALIDDDGWLRSGDLGTFDDHGYLRITGRKKDLIITAHGKNISPQNIETDLAAHPLIGQAVVIGDGRRYLTALLALDENTVEDWARAHNKGTVGLESLARDPDLHAEIMAAVEATNGRHAHVEHIRKWRVLPRALTVAGGELTPTLKVKRACRQRAVRRPDRGDVRRTLDATIVLGEEHQRRGT